jgi:hypothetical protein
VIDRPSRHHDALDVLGREQLVVRASPNAELPSHLLGATRPSRRDSDELDTFQRERVPSVDDTHPAEPRDTDPHPPDLRP